MSDLTNSELSSLNKHDRIKCIRDPYTQTIYCFKESTLASYDNYINKAREILKEIKKEKIEEKNSNLCPACGQEINQNSKKM